EAAYNAKKAEIEKSALTADEKAAKQAELDKAKEDAIKFIDAATDDSGVAKALEAGKSAIATIDTTASAEKAAAKKDLEEAYNAKKAEIATSALTADEKAAKQAELDKAKADADKAIDAATDNAGVDTALETGKTAIAAIDTTTSAEKAAAKQDLEAAYNAKKAEIEKSALTADEKAAKQAELDKAKADADKAIDAATDNAGVDTALADGKATIVAIDTTASAKKADAKKDLEEAYNAKKDAIINSGLTAEEKAAKQVELDKAKADADKAIDAATTDADVDTALNKGKADIAAIDPSASAEKAAAKKKSVLPNTGDNIGLSSILGVSGLALLGIAIRKKREN
ncbi:TPA: LPXTG cell wall anchor domain-containing protein, partial [Streptococcus suis]